MIRLRPLIATFFLVCLVGSLPLYAQSTQEARLKALISMQGAAPVQLSGYGLVVGLDRTGDRARGNRGAAYTVKSIVNMLERFGVSVDADRLSSRNTAAVMVTASMSPFSGTGSDLDVTVSAMGDARSLSGGVLLQTPLVNPVTQTVHGMAQGPLSTGSAEASTRGTSVRVNHNNTGRIPNGATITTPLPFPGDDNGFVGLVLKDPDFTNASKISEAINNALGDIAETEHAGLVNVQIPQQLQSAAELMAALEGITVSVDQPSRVVINERTGTIVAGGGVSINEVMVTYGNLVISTEQDPFVSQPNAFGEGETVQGAEGEASITQEEARSVVLPPNTNVNELAQALNELGLTARDVISIFQSIDKANALQGNLIIL